MTSAWRLHEIDPTKVSLNTWRLYHTRLPDMSTYWKIIFFISHPKHMWLVLKGTVSMRRFL